MEIEFTKMSGAGNDFIFLGPRYMDLLDAGSLVARRLCERKRSIGADGLIFVEKGSRLRMHYYNSDGSRASFCGNGARCFVVYCITNGIADNPFEFQSDAGAHLGKLMGSIPSVSVPLPRILREVTLSIDGNTFKTTLVEAGVPHAVVSVARVAEIDVVTLGRKIRSHDKFGKQGANVDFVEIIDNRQAKVRTYERGVEDETLACGSGCVAVGYLLWELGMMQASSRLHVASGDTLTVEIDEARREVFLGGPARIVYEGRIDAKELQNV